MTHFLALTLTTALGLVLGTSAVPAGPPATDVRHDGRLVQVTRIMTLNLAAPPDRAFPLFGPVREKEWSPHWNPEFVVPQPPAQSQDGAVFTTGDSAAIVWVMTDFDPHARLVRYVHFDPIGVVAQLWIQVSAQGPRDSRASVTYRLTAVRVQGRPAVEGFAARFPLMQQHWETAINAALAGGGGQTHP